jgi:hypothetical protein
MIKWLKSTYLFLLLGICFCSSVSYGQVKKDTAKTFKNTIRINITNPLIFGEKYDVIGYERILKHNQSFSFNIGRFSLPKLSFVNLDSLQLKKGSVDKGFTIATDYRFYLRKENKYPAPRGIYLGPYYSFSTFERVNTWSMNTTSMTGDIQTDMRLDINMVGGQLGYQFVVWNRLSIDLILMGPGVWFYNFRTTINTNLDPADEALVFEKINEILAAKLPGHEILIKPGQYHNKGSGKAVSPGFRYLVNLGFRF